MKSPHSVSAKDLLEGQLTLRAVALYEGAKALVALALGSVAAFLLHGDLGTPLRVMIERVGLDPDGTIGSLLLHSTHSLEAIGGRAVFALTLLYAAIRFAVALGLWMQRAWGEWLGATSGAIYVPFELHAVVRHPGWLPLFLLVANLAIIVFLCARLWRRRSPRVTQ